MGRSVRSVSVAALVAAFLLLTALTPALAISPGVIVGYSDTIRSFGQNTPITVNGPTLAAGTWWVRITAELDASGSAVTSGETECDLTDGTTTLDQAFWLLDYGHFTGRADVSLTLSGVQTATSTWTPSLHCSTKAAAGIALEFIRIDAVSGALSGSTAARLAIASNGPTTVVGDGAFHTVGSLALPAGRWSILAKTNVANASLSVTTDVTCRISPSNTDSDRTTLSLNRKTLTGGEGEIAVEVAHAFSAAATVRLECRGSSAASFATDKVKLIAIKAGKLTRTAVGGSTTTTGSGTPQVATAFRNSSIAVPSNSTLGTLASLALPAGKWYVSAKARVNGQDMKIQCQLVNGEGGGFLGTIEFRAGTGGSSGLYVQNGVDVTTSVHEVLKCETDTAGASLTFIRLTAIKASSIAFVFLG